MCSSATRWDFRFKNNLENQYPSSKMDLDFFRLFWRVKSMNKFQYTRNWTLELVQSLLAQTINASEVSINWKVKSLIR